MSLKREPFQGQRSTPFSEHLENVRFINTSSSHALKPQLLLPDRIVGTPGFFKLPIHPHPYFLRVFILHFVNVDESYACRSKHVPRITLTNVVLGFYVAMQLQVMILFPDDILFLCLSHCLYTDEQAQVTFFPLSFCLIVKKVKLDMFQ